MVLAIGLLHRLEAQALQRQQIEHYMATMQLTIAPLMPVKDSGLFKAQLNKLRAISLLSLDSISIYNTDKTLLITTGLPDDLASVEPDFDDASIAIERHSGYWFAQLPLTSTKTEPFLPSMSEQTYILFAVFQAETAYISWFMPIVIVGIAGMALLFIIQSYISQQQQRLQTDVGLISHKLSQIFAGQHNVSMNEDIVPELVQLKPAINELATYQTRLLQQHKALTEQQQQDNVQCQEQSSRLSQKLAELERQYAELDERIQNHVQSFTVLLSLRPEMDDTVFQQTLATQIALLRMELTGPHRQKRAMQLTHIVESFLPEAQQWLAGKDIELNLIEGANNAAYEIACCAELLNTMLMALVQLGARANAVNELTLSIKLSLQNDTPTLQLAMTSNGDGISAQLCQRLTGELTMPLQWHEADIGVITTAVKRFNAVMDIQLLDGLGSAIVIEFPVEHILPVQVAKLQHVLLFEQPQGNLNEHANSLKLVCEHVVRCSDLNELDTKVSQFAYDAAIVMLPEPMDLSQWQHVLTKLNAHCNVQCFSCSNHEAIWREALPYNIKTGPFCLADLGKVPPTSDISLPKLLVVDDNQTNLAFVQILMKGQQVELFTVDCGLDAIKLCQQHRFDTVLLDIQLPDISGTDVVRQLRQLPSYQDTPVLAFTAHALEEEVAEFLQAGMNDVIFKPLEAAKLGQILRWCSARKTDNVR